MLVYHYDPDTGVYNNTSSEADADPLEKGKFLIPAHATSKIPPAVPNIKTQQPVFRDGAWVVEMKPVKKIEPKDNIKDAPRGLVKGLLIIDVLKQETVDRGN